ncbi:MAG: hypothetical protein ABI867_45405, partial [Kofleriaceae bacterium]
MKIADLPFAERPVLELLNLHVDRPEPDHDYAGYGWAQVDRIWIGAEGAAKSIDKSGERRTRSGAEGAAKSIDK